MGGRAGDDHVAATEDNCVSGETAPGDDAHHRCVAAELTPKVERGRVQVCGEDDVTVTRSATTALGKEDDRKAPFFSNPEQAVFLLVVLQV